MRHFLEQGGERVLWVEPYPTRLPSVRDLRRPDVHDAGSPLLPGVETLAVPALPVEPLPGGTLLNRVVAWRGVLSRLRERPVTIGVGRSSALAVLALDTLRPSSSFYDAMDDFAEFYGGLSCRSMARRERELIARVDVVYASSSYLLSKRSGWASGRSPSATAAIRTRCLSPDRVPPAVRCSATWERSAAGSTGRSSSSWPAPFPSATST